jgi:hypothetical protein
MTPREIVQARGITLDGLPAVITGVLADRRTNHHPQGRTVLLVTLSPRARRAYSRHREAGLTATHAYRLAKAEDNPLEPDTYRDWHSPSDLAGEWTADVDGLTYRIALYHDIDASPLDAECYDEDDIEAWRDERWHYYGVVVKLTGQAGEGEASLWGVEIGDYWPGSEEAQVWLAIVDNEMLDEARADLLRTTSDVSAELGSVLA